MNTDISRVAFDLSDRQIKRVSSEQFTYRICNGVGTLSDLLPFEDTIAAFESTSQKGKDLKMGFVPEQYLPNVQQDTGNRHISTATLREVIEGKFEALFDHFVILDCRYKYEYNGGHINGALNMQDSQLLELLFKANVALNKRIAWIFHCEYSQKRGPRAASLLRKLDRTYNGFNYPNTCFPHCYVLNGGYKNYFEHIVKPAFGIDTYVSMFDEQYKVEMLKYGKLDEILWANQKRRTAKKKFRKKKQIRKKTTTFRTQTLCLLFVAKLKKRHTKSKLEMDTGSDVDSPELNKQKLEMDTGSDILFDKICNSFLQ